MGYFNIICLLLVLLVNLKTSASKPSMKNHVRAASKNEFTKLINRSKRSWQGKETGIGNGINICYDHNECPDGYACLAAGFGKAKVKARKICYKCDCMETDQCNAHFKGTFCNCSGSGFTGEFCETNIDDCVNATCENGATCLDGVNEYTCQCAEGYTGVDCGTSLDGCNPFPCSQGQSCITVGNDYVCTCDPVQSVSSTTELFATTQVPKTKTCSPGFPFGYSDNLSVQWNITADVGKVIWVTIRDFLTELNNDVVYVRDGQINGVQACLGMLSGTVPLPFWIQSSTNELTITFVSDSSNNFLGFCFTYFSF